MISRSAAASASNLSVDPRVLWHLDDRIAGEDQLQPARKRRRIPLEVREQLAAALVFVDPADVDRERPADIELAAEPRPVGPIRHIRTDPDDDAWHSVVLRYGPNHGALFGRVVHQGSHTPEDRREQADADRRVAFRRRHEYGLRREAPREMKSEIVAIAEQQEEVVACRVACGMADERRARRAFAVEPVEFVLEGMRPLEHSNGSAPEFVGMPLAVDRKPEHTNAVDLLLARGELVPPGDVIARAGGEDIHSHAARQPLGDITSVELGAAIDVGAVPLDDDRQLHD